jgi:predicted ATPase with chaperone activity
MPETEFRPAFVPPAPADLQGLGIPWRLVVDLSAKRLNLDGVASLESLALELKLPAPVIESVFRYFQKEKLVEIRGSDGDAFNVSLTAAGHKFASDRAEVSHYAGPAPVSLRDYQAAVRAQLAQPKVNRENMRRVFSDLVVENEVLDQLGPALISQKSLFLFGPSGNGKTSLAERLVKVYDDVIVMPYAVEVDGQIISVYDPVVHQIVDSKGLEMDPRWIVCQRPAVIVGGELTAEMLELRLDPVTNIYAAPVQMKANNGILVIDDFGRQVIPAATLLNRWILPLDRKMDYLNLSYGLKFQVPFELMIVFATNLEPSALMDPAFLRRLPNKVMIHSVPDRCFLEIFRKEADKRGFEHDPQIGASLLELCRRLGGKSLRACFPRDICEIARCINSYEERPHRLSPAILERAVELYFAESATINEDETLS